jgi:tRNA G37 N-methylase Trm5
MSRSSASAGRVFAIESLPETFNILCANLAINAISNTRPINAFVAAFRERRHW